MDVLDGCRRTGRREADERVQQKAAADVVLPQRRAQGVNAHAYRGGEAPARSRRRAPRAHGQRAEMHLRAFTLVVGEEKQAARLPAEGDDPRGNVRLPHPAHEGRAVFGGHAVCHGSIAARRLHHAPEGHELAVGEVAAMYAGKLAHGLHRPRTAKAEAALHPGQGQILQLGGIHARELRDARAADAGWHGHAAHLRDGLRAARRNAGAKV